MAERPYEFIFSFRSPYAWMAAAVLMPKLATEAEVRWTPFFPLPSFPNFPPLLAGKTRYLIRDVSRLAEFHGLKLEFPSIGDPDWSVPHAAFERAEELGHGPEFALELFAARWSRGQNLGEISVIGSAAESVGLESADILAAAQDPARREALRELVQSNFDERGIFGVPTLITPAKQRYWGHDRIEWALREGFLPTRA